MGTHFWLYKNTLISFSPFGYKMLYLIVSCNLFLKKGSSLHNIIRITVSIDIEQIEIRMVLKKSSISSGNVI